MSADSRAPPPPLELRPIPPPEGGGKPNPTFPSRPEVTSCRSGQVFRCSSPTVLFLPSPFPPFPLYSSVSGFCGLGGRGGDGVSVRWRPGARPEQSQPGGIEGAGGGRVPAPPLQVAGCEVSDLSRAPGDLGLLPACGLRASPGLAAGDCCLVTDRVGRAGGGWPERPDPGSNKREGADLRGR